MTDLTPFGKLTPEQQDDLELADKYSLKLERWNYGAQIWMIDEHPVFDGHSIYRLSPNQDFLNEERVRFGELIFSKRMLLQHAHKMGLRIEFLSNAIGKWDYYHNPNWHPNIAYRIAPDQSVEENDT